MAADIVVTITGLDEYLGRLRKLDEALRGDAVTDALMAGALVIEAHAKDEIQHGTKTGRVYRRGGIEHRASARGEAPATDIGFLVNSIGSKRGKEEAIVHVGAEYGVHLEYGTSRMAARPFLRPAVNDHMDEINAACALQLAKSLEAALG